MQTCCVSVFAVSLSPNFVVPKKYVNIVVDDWSFIKIGLRMSNIGNVAVEFLISHYIGL